MNLLVVILKKANLVADICKELAEKGVHGGTIIDGTGMASVIEKMDDLPMFGMLKAILADDDDNEVVKTARQFSDAFKSVAARREIKKKLRAFLWIKYQLKYQEVFDKAYSYIEMYY